MEEVGTQVAPPISIHNNIGGRYCDAALIGKKRGHLYGAGFVHPHQMQVHSVGGSEDGWNPKDWEWDSTNFLARGSRAGGKEDGGGPGTSKSGIDDDDDENGSSLQLQLGGAHGSNKKARSGSPGSGGNYPMCQVDDCREHLSKAKEYHRRHKVCEAHSKAVKALVGKQMQRFCQQCSRFHPLSAFDEGKRSCRRRLAGHNRRRRKTQPEDATSPAIPNSNGNTGNGNLDIVNLLTVLACGQGNAERNALTSSPSLPDNNQLIHLLSRINSLPASAANSLTATKNFEQGARGQSMNVGPQSTTDLLAVLSATVAASSPGAAALLSQSQRFNPVPSADMEKHASLPGVKDDGYSDRYSDGRNKPAPDSQSLGGERERSSSSCQSDSDFQVQDTRPTLPLQLFSSSPGDSSSSPPNLASSSKYFSSDSSNPTSEERSPSTSPPVTKKLFPLNITLGSTKPNRTSFSIEADMNVEANQSETSASRMTLNLFNIGNRAVGNSPPYQTGYTCSSDSDHSPPSFNSDYQQNRTGRILFKLFDKDPSHLPLALRTQIYNWLSNSPSEMESYIRPGCVVLSVYASMSPAAWGQLEGNILRQVSALVQGSDSEFWKSGRFSVNIGRQLAVHKEGRIRICKPWNTPSSPELVMVSPLAVVSGQSTSLVLRGRNLASPGTKIHCVYMGSCSSEEVVGSPCQGFMYDEIKWRDFKVQAAAPSILGRCFIEVENGVRGSSFPVIIADDQICKELRLLEYEFCEEAKAGDITTDEQVQNVASPRSYEEVLHFLNELGWLFQRQASSGIDVNGYMMQRFQFLLTFSTERDYCALVKKLLDIFVDGNTRVDGLSTEYMETLAKMHLLHRAVKRRSRKMVDLLIHYSVPCGNGTTKKYVFPPNLRGPGGITPLHLAACTSGSYDIVDALTNDPMQIGLNCWKCVLDDNRQSPHAYAAMRNNHSFNNMVAQKLVDRRNGQLSLSVGNDITESQMPAEVRQRTSLQLRKGQISCSKCAMMTYGRMSSSQGSLHRPFIHSMLAVAAVCVCVCLFFKSFRTNSFAPYMWENMDFGSV